MRGRTIEVMPMVYLGPDCTDVVPMGTYAVVVSLPATEADYLRYQYDDSEKLRIRIETHERFTVGDADFNAVLIEHVQPVAGQWLLDVGCGPGLQHAPLQASGVRVTGVDVSMGMLREARS